MRDLTPVRLSGAGALLVLTDGSGVEYAVPVASLRETLGRAGTTQVPTVPAPPQTGQPKGKEPMVESSLRPRDIQSRIRAGESAEDVAAVAGHLGREGDDLRLARCSPSARTWPRAPSRASVRRATPDPTSPAVATSPLPRRCRRLPAARRGRRPRHRRLGLLAPRGRPLDPPGRLPARRRRAARPGSASTSAVTSWPPTTTRPAGWSATARCRPARARRPPCPLPRAEPARSGRLRLAPACARARASARTRWTCSPSTPTGWPRSADPTRPRSCTPSPASTRRPRSRSRRPQRAAGRTDATTDGRRGSRRRADASRPPHAAAADRRSARRPGAGRRRAAAGRRCRAGTRSCSAAASSIRPAPSPRHRLRAMSSFVTGATGFIGRHLVAELVDAPRGTGLRAGPRGLAGQARRAATPVGRPGGPGRRRSSATCRATGSGSTRTGSPSTRAPSTHVFHLAAIYDLTAERGDERAAERRRHPQRPRARRCPGRRLLPPGVLGGGRR